MAKTEHLSRIHAERERNSTIDTEYAPCIGTYRHFQTLLEMLRL